MRNTIWNTARKMTLGLAVAAGLLTVGAVSAKAAPIQFEVGFGGRPACPGQGYVWVEGYDNGGYWVPGAWVFRGFGPGYGYGYRSGYGYRGGFRYDHERRFDGYRDHDRGWDRGHGWDRGAERGNDRHFDGGRGFERGRGNDHGFGGDHHGRR